MQTYCAHMQQKKLNLQLERKQIYNQDNRITNHTEDTTIN